MTYMEEIKLTLANNECSIAENAYKKEEAEHDLAKQIKELLDKNISKEDIANVIKLPIEDLNSLLERFYPQNPEEADNLDIQTQLDFLKQQVHILQKKLDNTQSENIQLKQQVNTIQAKGVNMEETIQTQEKGQQWEYKTISTSTSDEELNKLGEENWELVATAVGSSSCGRLMFKRPKQLKKQKQQDYYYGR